MFKKLMTMREVADLIGVSEHRAYELARRGILPVIRLGRSVRVHPDRLGEWLDAGGSAAGEQGR